MVRVLLGSGTFGSVYMEEGKVYKCFNLNVPGVQIIREASIIKQLAHVNIIKFMGLKGRELQMEYGGIRIMDYLITTNRALTVWEILPQIESVLTYMNENGVIHRDIKPSNILVKSNNGKPLLKLCDFGISRYYDNEMSWQPATINYRAPELYIETSKYTSDVDIWSMGCVLYELITGKTLFNGKTETTIIQSILQLIPCSSEDLMSIGLQIYVNIKGRATIYKIPQLYGFEECNMQVIEKCKLLSAKITSMIVINPRGRNKYGVYKHKTYKPHNINKNTYNLSQSTLAIADKVYDLFKSRPNILNESIQFAARYNAAQSINMDAVALEEIMMENGLIPMF